jgi:hypothetical protein
VAEQTEVSVSYSYDIKANLGQGTYESASVHISKSERWSVGEGEDADQIWRERYQAIKEEIDPLVEEEYKGLSCYAVKDDPAPETGDDKS